MPNLMRAFAAPGSGGLRSLDGSWLGDPTSGGWSHAVRAGRDRERRQRAEAAWRRFASVCRRELLRRDAEPGRGR
jgi:hypothetical protein